MMRRLSTILLFLMLVVSSACAQQLVQVSGTVVSQTTGKALAGASVTGDGHTVVTNDDGYFVIPCSSPKAIVRVTHVSYSDFEKTCQNGDVGMVTLAVANHKLNPAEAVGTLADAKVTKRSYHSLWRQAYKYATKQLPRSQMGVMDQIMVKARYESNYGQLLAAEMMKTSLMGELSPDSIPDAIGHLVEEER